jgi:signal transduction histidine kinase
MQLEPVIPNRPASAFERTANAQALHFSRLIVGIACSLAICMWGFIAWSAWSEQRTARDNGWTQGYNLTAAVANELTRTFDAIDAEFRAIDTDFNTLPPDASARALRLALASPQPAGLFTDIRIANPDGHRVFSAQQQDQGPADYSRQPHFIAHRDSPKTGLLVDKPEAAASGAENRIEVSERLDAPGGGFGGEAMLLLRAANLIYLNREIDIGNRGLIAIVGLDGTVLAGYDRDHPDGSVGVGVDLSGAPFPNDPGPGGTIDYMRVGRISSVERLVTVRRLAAYPVEVLVALDLNDVLEPARNHLWFVGLVGLGASGLILALSLLLVREVRRRTRREIELSYDRDRLALAQAQIEADRARLAETNRELLASKEAADAANRAKSQFLAHMSHELRTPLHAIIGFSELIKDQAPTGPDAPAIGAYARDIWMSGRHLLELINSILDISKVESGTATLAETVFPVEDVARASLVSVRSQAESRAIAIDVKLPADRLNVRADRTRLQQVLINLLSNAVKFTPDNGHIVLAARRSVSGELVLSVTDSGIGMSEADIEVAMTPFGQVDNSLSRSFEGTGLGLPLACRLVELHGGRLDLKSIKGRGTTATVTLPADRLC